LWILISGPPLRRCAGERELVRLRRRCERDRECERLRRRRPLRRFPLLRRG
jgi:hypothetical protein